MDMAGLIYVISLYHWMKEGVPVGNERDSGWACLMSLLKEEPQLRKGESIISLRRFFCHHPYYKLLELPYLFSNHLA